MDDLCILPRYISLKRSQEGYRMTRYRAGERIEVKIDREGLGLDEGIGHLPDDTMVVIVGAGQRVGQIVEAIVTAELQTSLGDSLYANVQP